jgi:hypothetical protein
VEEVRTQGEIGGNAPRFVALPPEEELAAQANMGPADQAAARQILAQAVANRQQQQSPSAAVDLV